MVQKIAIIGGTGMTGQCVVDYALSKGEKYRILAFNANQASHYYYQS